MKARTYIAGPMRGYDNFNFAMFDQCRDYLASMGVWGKVVSPADHDRKVGSVDVTPTYWPSEGHAEKIALSDKFSITDSMRWDLRQITRCTHIVMLPGWASSRGARLEKKVAEACGVFVRYFYPPSESGRLYDSTQIKLQPLAADLEVWA